MHLRGTKHYCYILRLVGGEGMSNRLRQTGFPLCPPQSPCLFADCHERVSTKHVRVSCPLIDTDSTFGRDIPSGLKEVTYELDNGLPGVLIKTSVDEIRPSVRSRKRYRSSRRLDCVSCDQKVQRRQILDMYLECQLHQTEVLTFPHTFWPLPM